MSSASTTRRSVGRNLPCASAHAAAMSKSKIGPTGTRPETSRWAAEMPEVEYGPAQPRKRIVIEFRDTTRAPARTEYMSSADAAATFNALAKALEEAGPEGDGWIRAGDTVVIRAREVHNMWLEEHVDLS